MERVNFRITLNLDLVNHQPAIYLKQSSIGSIRLTVRLQKDGKPYDISDQCAVSAYALLPEEKHYLDDCKVEDGAIIYDIDKTIPAGKTAVEFTISEATDGKTNVLAAPTVYIISTAPVFDDSIPEATSDFSALQAALAEAKEYSLEIEQKKETVQKATEEAYDSSIVANRAAEKAEKAATLAEAAAQVAASKNTAGSVLELNKSRCVFLWYGTKEEYEAQKDSLPENTDCTIIDDDSLQNITAHIESANNPHKVTYDQVGAAISTLVYGTHLISSGDELDQLIATKYAEMTNSSIRSIVIQDTKGISPWGGGNAHITMYRTSESYGSLACVLYGTAVQRLYRSLMNGTWGEWEYENPPINIGVEYRTTERFLGEPVYVKCVNMGSLASGESVNVAFSDVGTKAIELSGTIGDTSAIVGYPYVSQFYAHNNCIYITMTANAPAFDKCYAVVKYVKL